MVQLTFRIGSADTVRAQFVNSSKLDNSMDTKFRAVSDNW
jgi:hypothetical protein